MRRTAFAFACLLSFAACSGDDGPKVAPECNPLGGTGCVTPWPSSIYLDTDSTSATGYRLAIPEAALPVNPDLKPIDTTRFNEHDGFSPAGYIFTAFTGGVNPSNLVGQDDIGASLTDASPTVLIDMDTGERIPHFAEVDANAYDYEIDEQALYIRPVVRLAPGHRFAVGIRTSLEAKDGGELPVPPAFEKLRQGKKTGHARLDAIADRWDDIFATFADAGIDKNDLVVAWDFVTASDDFLTSSMLGARDAALTAMGDKAANESYQVTTDDPEADDARIARRVIGTFTMPLVLTGTGDSAELARDAGGAPMVNGTADSRFVAMIPACATAANPVPIVIFGHGFFGDIGEAQGEHMRRVADQLCVIVLGTEWYGMSKKDITGAALALNDASGLIGFGERIVQGIVAFITLEQIARGSFATDLLVDGTGAPLADPSKVYFYGISQGHVLGSTFMAYDPYITRGVLSNGGASWSILFERSTNWPNFQLIINGAYQGPLNTTLIEALMQLGLDYTENMHVDAHILGTPLPGAPEKQVLLQMAVNDTSVTNLATEAQARVMNLPVLSPSVRIGWGLEGASAPQSSALVVYDEHPDPPAPTTNIRNINGNDTHTTMRTRNAAVEQIQTYLETGEVVDTCGGACDCATGACD